MSVLNLLPKSVFVVIAAIVIVAGCSKADPAVERAEDQPAITPAAAREPETIEDDTTGKETDAVELVEESATFDPPFPNRTDPFAQPTAHRVAEVVRERREQTGADVQLKGFVHVDQPKAMLRIDGQLWIASAGDSRDGFEVLTVAPPLVKLKRDEKNIELSLHDRG